jgi:hypothetical protein
VHGGEGENFGLLPPTWVGVWGVGGFGGVGGGVLVRHELDGGAAVQVALFRAPAATLGLARRISARCLSAAWWLAGSDEGWCAVERCLGVPEVCLRCALRASHLWVFERAYGCVRV